MTNSKDSSVPFKFTRRVAYYDTDAMGVVHHSNYVRYFEDARVAWMREIGLHDYHAPQGAFVFAVHEMTLAYKKPLRFDEIFDVDVKVRLDGIRLRFDYAITRSGEAVADGTTVIIPLDSKFRPARLPAAARALF